MFSIRSAPMASLIFLAALGAPLISGCVAASPQRGVETAQPERKAIGDTSVYQAGDIDVDIPMLESRWYWDDDPFWYQTETRGSP
jgi:hypothetical protein